MVLACSLWFWRVSPWFRLVFSMLLACFLNGSGLFSLWRWLVFSIVLACFLYPAPSCRLSLFLNGFWIVVDGPWFILCVVFTEILICLGAKSHS